MRAVIAFLLALLAAPALAVTCADTAFDGRSYTICTVDPAREGLHLFLRDSAGQPYGDFGAVETAEGALAFGMNAGMYHPDRAPVGLYVEDGVQVTRLLTADSPGNFGLLPNGVFCIAGNRAFVVETLAFAASGRACEDATQSGPMLVIDGAMHPRFLPDSTSRNIRNGVGTTAAGDRVVFAISNEAVTFHEFARLFRDRLGLPDALYFDGRISRLHAPALGRSDWGAAMGPIVGVLAD